MNQFKQLKPDERPDERCLMYGPSMLSDRELLSILLRTGTKDRSVLDVAEAVLTVNPEYDGLVGLMHHSISEYAKISGIGEKKAIQLSVVGEISRRIWNRSKRPALRSLNSAAAVYDYYKEDLRYLDHEEIFVMFLDNHMQLMKDFKVSQGTCSRSAVSARDILREGLRISAVGMILVHNHPSGNPEPSEDDVQFTSNLKFGGNLVGIVLIDHVVIGDNSYYSFKEQKII